VIPLFVEGRGMTEKLPRVSGGDPNVSILNSLKIVICFLIFIDLVIGDVLLILLAVFFDLVTRGAS
jgi:hypothetical protein